MRIESDQARTDPATPTCYYEDFNAGQVIDVGSITVNEAEIIAFARQYDPQPMHTDPRAAGFTIYGGLIASGWHTVALFMRLLVENLVGKTTSRVMKNHRARRDIRL